MSAQLKGDPDNGSGISLNLTNVLLLILQRAHDKPQLVNFLFKSTN